MFINRKIFPLNASFVIFHEPDSAKYVFVEQLGFGLTLLGGIENAGEHSVECARRVMVEQTDMSSDDDRLSGYGCVVDYLHSSPPTKDFPFRSSFFLVSLDSLPRLGLGHKFKWFTIDFSDPTMYGMRKSSDQGSVPFRKIFHLCYEHYWLEKRRPSFLQRLKLYGKRLVG